jgi:tetratricopeptide (TPR) repeat protein
MKPILLSLFVFLFLFNNGYGQSLNDQWLDNINQGKEEYAINNYQKALDFFQKAAKLIPTDTTAYNYLMDCAYKIQNAKVVYDCFDKLSILENLSPRTYQMAINMAIDVDKDYQKAVTYAETAKQQFPGNIDILFDDINIYYNYGDYAATKAKLNQLIENHPDIKKAYDLLIHIQLGIERDYTATLETILAAQEKFPNEVEYMKKEVNIYLETGAIAEAETKFRKLIELNPDDPKHYYNLSLILHNKSEYEQSIEYAQKAIDLNPDFLEAIFNVGTFYYYRALKYAQALTEMTAFQYTFEGQGKNIEDAAISYFETAKPYFERAIQLNPNELGAFENLNTINVLLGNLYNNQKIAAPFFSGTEVILEDNMADLDIEEIAFVYSENETSLKKGQTGELQLTIQNYTNFAGTNFEILMMQPFINTNLTHPEKFVLDSIGPLEKKVFSIPITYQENNAQTVGVEKVEGSNNIVRFYIAGKENYHTDMYQYDILVGNIGDVNIDFSETIDIDFTPETRPTNFLLVIGIDSYQHWNPLGNAVIDSKNVKEVLISKYDIDKQNVFELYNNDATKNNIINELIKIKRDLSENDNLIIYYAGHGDYNSAKDEGAWIPVDAHLNMDDEYLDNSTLLSYLKALNTKHTFLIADACFSGSLFVSDDEMSYKPNNDKIKSRWGFTSGNIEFVADGSVGEGSPFAKFLVEALEENQREHIAVTELISYVKFKVRNTNAQTPIGRPLKIDGNEGGEFLIYTKQKI